ncbi:MAG: PHP domain-containing protein [Planctomycetes bacterium]|nr:PHP domain-containing protein [Planctomycetota bacterium]
MTPIRTAIHLHTNHSFDSNRTPRDLIDQAVLEGIGCVAITDHDAIDGAFEAQRCAGGRTRVIIGEEVSTRDGHVIGLFLKRWIEPGRSAEETIEAIRRQGGLVLAPHPFATLCDDSLHGAIERIAHLIDAVEIHNAQNVLAWQDRRAASFARQAGLPAYVGCDGHLSGRLAPAYQVMSPFAGPSDFLASLGSAKLVAKRYGLGYFARMGMRHVWDKLMPIALPGYGVNALRRPPAAAWARRILRRPAQSFPAAVLHERVG